MVAPYPVLFFRFQPKTKPRERDARFYFLASSHTLTQRSLALVFSVHSSLGSIPYAQNALASRGFPACKKVMPKRNGRNASTEVPFSITTHRQHVYTTPFSVALSLSYSLSLSFSLFLSFSLSLFISLSGCSRLRSYGIFLFQQRPKQQPHGCLIPSAESVEFEAALEEGGVL